VASVQVPFISGGAEMHARGLVEALRAAGHPTELVTLPFRFFPDAEVARAMEVWASENFAHLNLYEPDRVICLKFPAWGLRHPDRVAWVLHQHRAAYELASPDAGASARALALEIKAFDESHLAGIPVFANSQRVAERMRQFNGIHAEPLYHPPPDVDKLYSAEALSYVFCPSRLEESKRQELLIRAMARVRSPVGAMLAGEGGQHARLSDLIAELGLASRVRLLGRVSAEELRSLYARSLMVFFGPVDEDYGYVTLEAMLSRKPVVTCTDSGGPLEFVVDGATGHVVPPDPESVADAIDRLAADRGRGRRMGDAGHDRARALDIRWERVVERLVDAR
jgi:glycosyltransferase involved in cell wall biosynthesis